MGSTSNKSFGSEKFPKEVKGRCYVIGKYRAKELSEIKKASFRGFGEAAGI